MSKELTQIRVVTNVGGVFTYPTTEYRLIDNRLELLAYVEDAFVVIGVHRNWEHFYFISDGV